MSIETKADAGRRADADEDWTRIQMAHQREIVRRLEEGHAGTGPHDSAVRALRREVGEWEAGSERMSGRAFVHIQMIRQKEIVQLLDECLQRTGGHGEALRALRREVAQWEGKREHG